jgi:hypothetical protein
VKFRREYTLTVLSEVAVARSGRPLGLGMETQAREDAEGLNSERAPRRTECDVAGGAEAIAILCCLGQKCRGCDGDGGAEEKHRINTR